MALNNHGIEFKTSFKEKWPENPVFTNYLAGLISSSFLKVARFTSVPNSS
jgi:hypothetical protein